MRSARAAHGANAEAVTKRGDDFNLFFARENVHGRNPSRWGIVPPNGKSEPRDFVKRPQYFGSLTNDIVYKPLAPGVFDELKRVTPRLVSGRHKEKTFSAIDDQ